MFKYDLPITCTMKISQMWVNIYLTYMMFFNGCLFDLARILEEMIQVELRLILLL